MACTVTYKGHKFKSVKEFNDYLLSQMTGKNMTKDLTQNEAAEKLKAASKNIRKLRETGERTFTSPSAVMNHIAPFTGEDKKEVATFSANEGTRYHNIAEGVINNLNEGKKPLHDLTYKDANGKEKAVSNQLDIQWAEQVAKLYREVFNPDGKSTVIPELTVGNAQRGISGDIDVAVITPEGKIRIYDYKTQLKKYDGKDTHAIQQHIYKAMLMQGDLEFDIPMMEVESMNIITIQLISKTAKNPDNKTTNHTLDGHDITQPIVNIGKDQQKFPHRAKYNTVVGDIFLMENEFKRDYNRVKMDHQANFQAIGETIIQLDTSQNVNKLQAIASTVKRDEDGKFYFEHNNEKHYFKHNDAHLDNETGRQRRAEAIRKFVGKNYPNENLKGNVADEFLKVWRGEKSYQFEEDKPQYRSIKWWIKNNFGNVSDAMPVKANSIPGMEMVGDDLIVIYSNYNEETGRYQNADILAVASDVTEGTPYSVGKNQTTLAGMVASDNQVQTVKEKLGLHHIKVFSRSKANERLIRVGLAATALRTSDPNLRIGMTATSNFPKGSSKNPFAEVGLDELLGNIQILTNLEVGGAKITENSAFDEHTKQILEDGELFDADNYKQSKITALFGAIASAMQDDNSQLKKDFEIAAKVTDEKDLIEQLSDVADAKKFIAEEVERINQDRERKEQVIQFINRMMKEIEERHNNEIERYSRDSEYLMLSQAVLQLENMIVSIDKATDIQTIQAWGLAPGDTQMEIINDYVENIKIGQKRVSMRVLNEFYPQKIKQFDKLFKASEKHHLATKGSGTHAKMFEPLFEYKLLPKISNPNEKVKVRTGRFWPKDSTEYQKLTQEQKDFIEWFNTETKKHLAKSLGPNKNIDDYWQEGNIPWMKATDGNMIYKVIHKGQSQDRVDQRVKAAVNRKLTQWENYDEVFDINSKNLTQLVDLYRNQVSISISEQDHSEYGPSQRLDLLGMVMGNDGNLYAKDEHENMQETNLEHIITALGINGYRVEELSPLMIQYKAVRTVLSAAKSSMGNDKFVNAEKFLQVWTEKILQQKNQLLKQKNLERAMLVARSVGSSVALGWNVFSQLKNTISGFGHVNIDNLVRSLSEGDFKRMKAYRKAFNEAKGLLKGSHLRTQEKVHSIMTSMAMGDMDPTSLLNNLIFQKTGRSVKMGKHVWNSIQDYGWRSIMLLTEMHMDGTINAYEEATIEGEKVWVYNEDKDPRFEGEEGKKLKQAIKERMVEEKVIKSTDEKMPFPYTIREQLRIREHANETFEAQNVEDRPMGEAYTLVKMITPMRSWLLSKVRRWWKPGHMNKQAGQFVYKNVKHEDDTVTKEQVWEGAFMEGIAQSYFSIVKSLAKLTSGGTRKEFMDQWTNMPYKRKENLIRGMIDFAFIGLLVTALRALFEDDEKDKVLYKLISSAMNELYFIEHAGGFGDLVTNPLPTISIFGQIGRGLFGDDSEKRMDSIMRSTGVGKVPQFVMDVTEDHG